MSSSSNANPWSPYDTYKDCSQGICSIYCPQWCYIIFPPPPPSFSDDDDSSADFSPLVIAVIGILASAFILVTYYTIVSRYCRRRSTTDSHSATELPNNTRDSGEPFSPGLDEALIKTITVCKYKKNDGFVEGTDCSVCLSEFQENESLRLLPKCNHAFHLPCIDPWLKNQASCPLCRSNIASLNPLRPVPAAPVRQSSQIVNVSALEYRQSNDTVLVVPDLERQEGVVVVVSDGERETEDSRNRALRRSVSLDSVSRQGPVRISDILQESEEEEDGYEEEENLEIGSLPRTEIGEGNSKSGGGRNRKHCPEMAMKRCGSTGRFIFSRNNGKGRSSSTINIIHT